MKPSDTHEPRIANLEIAFAHHQRDYDTLNSVVTEYANQIDALKRTVQRLTERLASLEALTSQTGPPRTLEDDRPPHY
jgi:uncharacterized coiled-coil protein SlyX